MSIIDGVKFQLSDNRAASSAISFSVKAASISADIFSWSIVFESDFIPIMKLLPFFLVNTVDAPNNSVVDSILFNAVNQRKEFSRKPELSIVSSQVVVNDRRVEHDILTALDDVFIGFGLFGNIVLF